MKLRPARFSLAAALIAFSAAAILLGFARWQRQKAIDEYARLHVSGVGLIMVVDAPDWIRPFADVDFWFRRPRTAEVYVMEDSLENLRIGSQNYDWQQAQTQLRTLKERLAAIGVSDVQIWTYSAVPPLSFPPQVHQGEDPQAAMERFRELSRRQGQVLQFGAENGMAGGGFGSADELQRRWEELRPD